MLEIEFRHADSDDTREVVALLASVFAAENGTVPSETLDDLADYFVAYASGRGVIAAFRLLGPHLRPFDFEHAFDLSALIAHGRRPALVGRLCVSPEFRRVHYSIYIHKGLLDSGVRWAHSQNITDLFMYTYERLLKFYTKAGFTDTHLVFRHQVWGEVHLMHRVLSQNASATTT